MGAHSLRSLTLIRPSVAELRLIMAELRLYIKCCEISVKKLSLYWYKQTDSLNQNYHDLLYDAIIACIQK